VRTCKPPSMPPSFIAPEPHAAAGRRHAKRDIPLASLG
jgi:hypothetical protein